MKKIRWYNTEKKRDDLDQLIPCIEKAYQIKFPDDFRECAIENGGGSPDPCKFDNENELGKTLENIFSLDPRSDVFFWYFVERIKYRALKAYPIATDTLQNFICLDYRQGFPPKIYYHKEGRYIPSEEHGTFICNSFTELLEMLY